MRVEIKKDKDRKGFFRVIPHGSIDTESHDEFRKAIEPLLAPSTRGVLLDLKNVDYVSSAGIGVLFAVKKALKSVDAGLLFCNLKPQIQKLFDIMKFLPKKTIFKSLEEADRYFYKIMNDTVKRSRRSRA